ncbi:hypothetical protein [Algibacillus agarilyticus]|uniref:hypothetical protein n=1 Tax=Algibacillus agarilyticus TaxID=2234133 RepID=UPI000DD09B6E|nr:hypothetical protein [Algibacillus agarilyticus]
MNKFVKQVLLALLIVAVIFFAAWLVRLLMNEGAFLFKSSTGSQSPLTSPFTWIFVVLGVVWGVSAKLYKRGAEKRFERSLKASLKKRSKD